MVYIFLVYVERNLFPKIFCVKTENKKITDLL